MNLLSVYFEELNQSNQELDTKSLWQSYRAQIQQVLSKKLTGKVAILGAGNLHDLDLDKMISQEAQVHLYDIDRLAMESGIGEQAYEGELVYHQVDFTGLSDKRFFEELGLLMSYGDIQGLLRYLNTTTVDLAREKKIIEKSWYQDKNFDVVWISPLYTQLVLGQVLDMIHYYDLESHREELVVALMKLMVALIENFNEAVVSMLKDKGELIILSDLMEYDSSDKEYDSLFSMSEKQLEAHFKEYESKYGQGLGSYGIHHMMESLDHVKKSNFLLWPFHENRVLLVKMIQGIK